jgi:[acyl-carrier-protein] S-malonyltransferase
MKAAALFPGQGAQYAGMGQDLYGAFPEAREVFDRADEVLGWKLSEVCFSGPQERLNATDVSQPALLATSIAALRSAWGRGGLRQPPGR